MRVFAAVCLLPLALAAPAAAQPPSSVAPLLDTLRGDLIAFDAPKPGIPTRIVLAARVRAPAASLQARLLDPGFYRNAVPWFIKADVLAERAGPGVAPGRLLAWELEVPLWNLDGRLWMRPVPSGAELEFTEGDLAPGRFLLSALPAASGAVLRIEARANISGVNFITRRLSARDPRAEAAMTATAAYVLLRALALEADRGSLEPPAGRWPQNATLAPHPDAMDGRDLASALPAALSALSQGAPPQAVARVRSRRDGRLDHVAIALRSAASTNAVQTFIATPSAWRALPGWADVRSVSGGAGADHWSVDATMPFVDFDAVWAVTPGPPLRARSVADDWVGAALRWDLTADGTTTRAVLSFHGRVENTGYFPRRLIAAEPLLEHGLSLGLAYVNAVSLLRALSAQPVIDLPTR